MRSQHYFQLSVIILLSDPLVNSISNKNAKIRNNNFFVCERKNCSRKTDREINWIFDQPEPVFLDDELRGHFEASHRVNINFRSVSSARPEADTSLPPVLHMIWLGSRLPPKFAPNILSYVSLNPDHELWLWLDTSPDTVSIKQQQVRVRDVNKETWSTRDMLDTSTNWAMKSDILRLEILYKYGGIYVDIDSVALRSFGPLFHHAFLSYRPYNWTMNDADYVKTKIVGTSGLQTNVMAASQNSAFMEFLLNSLKENFPTESATLYKTGPYFFKEAFLQYPFSDKIPLISHYYLNNDRATPDAILVDNPSDSMWDDKEDVLRPQWRRRPDGSPLIPQTVPVNIPDPEPLSVTVDLENRNINDIDEISR